MITWVLWTKVGMSQITNEQWNIVPVTYVLVEDNEILQLKTIEKDWYNAVILWANPYNKPTKTKKFKNLKEFKVDSLEWLKIWDKVDVSVLSEEKKLHITWFTKGKWFQGPVKRWNRSIARKTHGTKFIRHGSTMNSAITWRSRKWIKMAGHMWNDQATLRNKEIPFVDTESKVVAVKWAVPGANGWLVILRKA